MAGGLAAALLPLITALRTSSPERADVKSFHQEEGRSGVVEYQFPLHDGVSCAHQCRPLCVADRRRALRRGVPICPRSESDGKHLRTSLRPPLRNGVPAGRNRSSDLDSRLEALPDRAPRSRVAPSSCPYDQAGRKTPLQGRCDRRRSGWPVSRTRSCVDGLLGHHLRSVAGGGRNAVPRHSGISPAAKRGRGAGTRDPRDRRHYAAVELCCRA